MKIHPHAICAARIAARLARGISRTLVAAYHSIDPDARRHLAQAPVLGLTLIARRRVAVKALPDDGWRPVVCVHGLAGHRGNFTPLRAWFRIFGRTRTYSIGFAPRLDIDGMVTALRAEIARVHEVNGLTQNQQLDLVCHSMGGIVARLALEDPATAARVASMVTLGTPHAGTHAARFAGTAHLLALRPQSELMQRLALQIPWAASMPRLICLWSRDDVLLQPAATATVPGADNRRVPGVTHLSYLLNPVSFHAAFTALEDPALRLAAAQIPA